MAAIVAISGNGVIDFDGWKVSPCASDVDHALDFTG
jgi:hypothetical protein